MLTYNPKFAAELKKGKSDPATLVYLQDSIFFDEKASEADWILNTSENNVDYTPSPPNIGDVELLKPETWAQLTSGATARQGHSAIEYNGKMYIFGGVTSVYNNDLWEYNIATDIWTQLTSGATIRANHSARESNGKMYIFGGLNSASNALNDLWEYDIATDTWSQLTSGASVRHNHSAIESNGKMYIFGGIDAILFSEPKNDLWEYNIGIDTWTQLTSSAVKLTAHSAIEYNGKMYIFGGANPSILVNSLFEYDIATNMWTQLTAGATARSQHSAIEYAGKMYIFGGYDGSTYLTDLWQYDPVSDTWLQLTSGASARLGHSAIEYSGKMYIFGGFDGSLLNDLWSHNLGYLTPGHITTNSFDLGSIPTAPGEWKIGDVVPAGTSLTYEAWSSISGAFAWTQKTSGATTRLSHTAIDYNGKMYIFGGLGSGGYLNDVWEYDIVGDSWTQKTSGASMRDNHTAIEYGGKMYIFGGWNGSSRLNDIWEYDIAGDSWAQKTSGAIIRSSHAAIEYNGKIYIFGGYDGSYLNDLWEYDIAGDSWSSLTSGATIRAGHSAIEYNGRLYIFGGFNGSYLNDLWEYDIAGDSWTQKASGATIRHSHTAIEYNGKMYIFGGLSSGDYLNDVWEYDIAGDSWTQKASGATIRISHTAIEYNGKMYIFGGLDSGGYLNDIWEYDILDVIYLGSIADGDAITDLKQYYRVKASFTSSPLRDKTPILSSITADFAEYLKIDHSIGLTSLTTTIDLFEESTISQMTVTLALTKVVSNWMAIKKPRNKRVRIFIGFRAEGFTDADFEKFYFGTVANADITADNKVKIYVEGLAKDWKEDVPNVWKDASDNVVWTDEHPIDVMLDIYREYLPVRDSALLLSSFYDVKAEIPGWVVTRTITDDPIEGKKLLEELRKLMSCFFIPQPDGSVKIKRWDPSEVAVAAITDTQLMSKNYKGNYKEIINRLYTYYDWAGTGDDAGDFNAVLPDARSDSKDDYGKFETETVKDKWTKADELAQVEDRSTKLLDRYENPPPLLPGMVDLKNLAIEEGDIIDVTTKRAPSTDMTGISVVRFQLVKKQINWQAKKLNWELLAVEG